jgi:DNA invertase Pin-like site-specific DNA recombinase
VAIIGYARVSTTDQNPQLQLDALREAGAARIFTDHGVSGSMPRRRRIRHESRPADEVVNDANSSISSIGT